MKRMNKIHLQLDNDTKLMLHVKESKYDSNNQEHEQILLLLWERIFPKEKLTARKSKQWVGAGFQGEDPATDFRAMGLYCNAI